MRHLSTVFLLLLVGMLSACDPMNETYYIYMPPDSNGKQCVAQCLQGKNACERLCELKNADCFSRSWQTARQQYAAYQTERRNQGQPVTKTIKNFVNNASCKKSCNCTVAFNTCYLACGGQVRVKKG